MVDAPSIIQTSVSIAESIAQRVKSILYVIELLPP